MKPWDEAEVLGKGSRCALAGMHAGTVAPVSSVSTEVSYDNVTIAYHPKPTISDCKFDELDYSLSEGGIGWRVGKRWGWLPRREECARLRCR